MGTRNLTCVVLGGEYRVAQYGQWDGYPGGQGATILNFLKVTDIDQFKNKVKDLRFITDKEYEDIIDKHIYHGAGIYSSTHGNYWNKYLWFLGGDIAAGILEKIMLGEVPYLKNSVNFAGDSLFCEWAYVVDLDKMTFEVYRGFNRCRVMRGERFADMKRSDSDYEPVYLVKLYTIDELPTLEEFIKNFCEDEIEPLTILL